MKFRKHSCLSGLLVTFGLSESGRGGRGRFVVVVIGFGDVDQDVVDSGDHHVDGLAGVVALGRSSANSSKEKKTEIYSINQ